MRPLLCTGFQLSESAAAADSVLHALSRDQPFDLFAQPHDDCCHVIRGERAEVAHAVQIAAHVPVMGQAKRPAAPFNPGFHECGCVGRGQCVSRHRGSPCLPCRPRITASLKYLRLAGLASAGVPNTAMPHRAAPGHEIVRRVGLARFPRSAISERRPVLERSQPRLEVYGLCVGARALFELLDALFKWRQRILDHADDGGSEYVQGRYALVRAPAVRYSMNETAPSRATSQLTHRMIFRAALFD